MAGVRRQVHHGDHVDQPPHSDALVHPFHTSDEMDFAVKLKPEKFWSATQLRHDQNTNRDAFNSRDILTETGIRI